LESVAEKYAIAGEHETARAVYQQVTQQCPSDHKAAVVAKAGLGRCDISSAVELGNESTTDAITSRLLSELANSEYQREAVHSLAYGLYTDLLAEASKTEESALVANYAMRIISLLENQLLPLNLPIQVRADAYLMLAECYYRLGVPTVAREYYQKHYNTSPGYRLECYSKHMVARCLEDELKLELVSENEAKPQIIEIHQNILSDYPECDAAEYAQEWLENNPQ
jgi:tetratricopeptide (TPR) repeat protein